MNNSSRNLQQFYCSMPNGERGINIEEVSPIRAAEEYAEAESLESGTAMTIEHCGVFFIRKLGNNYIACYQ